MSDTTEGVDNGEEIKPQSPPVAPPQGEPPVPTPAPGDTPETPSDEPKPEDEGEKQSRREARAFATLRRENRELYRRQGMLEALLQQASQRQNGEEVPQQRPVQTPPAFDPAEEELKASIRDRIADEGEEYEAAVEKIASQGFPMTVPMRDYLATSKNPAPVAKALADDPKEALRISLLSERAADRAMEQLEARVTQKPAPRTTRALPPVRTVGGSSSVRPDPAKMDMDDYVKWRNSQQR